MGNKVKYNLKNVHYAPMTAPGTATSWPTYGTPVPWPGAVEMSLEQQGSISKFYADGITYWQAAKNNGYEGDYSSAMVPDSFREDCLGEELEETDKVYLEKATAIGTAFALLFEFDGDASGIKHVLYNCTATRPPIEGKTAEEEIEPDTETLTISAAALPNGYVKAKTGDETTSTVVNSWFEEVYTPTASYPDGHDPEFQQCQPGSDRNLYRHWRGDQPKTDRSEPAVVLPDPDNAAQRGRAGGDYWPGQ